MFNMVRLIVIGEATKAPGVSSTTLPRWEAEGKLIPERAATGHPHYELAKLKPEMFHTDPAERCTVVYAHVSSHNQTDDLERQKQELELYCAHQGWTAVSDFATLSTQELPVPGPKPHKSLLKHQQRLSHSLSSKEKGSATRRKAKAKLARLHAHISNICKAAQHRLTTDLTRWFHTIGIKNLNVKGMLCNHHLARSIANSDFHEFWRQLDYKVEMRGGVVVVADRWLASSKTCSHCGHKPDRLPLSVREWVCLECSMKHDRDRNGRDQPEESRREFYGVCL